MFKDRRSLHRWAARVLLVWLFGLAVGVANACALGASAHHVDGIDLAAGTAPSQGGHEADGHCQDFCEKASTAVPKLTVVDESPVFAGPLTGAVDWTVPPAPALSHRAFSPMQPRSTLPLRIVLQRLAL
jgi:hypothetical protein